MRLLVIVLAGLALSGCGWRGLNTLPLPGTEGRGDDAFEITAQMPDVSYIQENSRVRVGDVTVGSVTRIERQGWHALVTMRLNGNVDLPANASIRIGQTSLLGSLHVEMGPPDGAAPEGRLHAGSFLPLSSAGAYPSTEQTLAAVSLMLNGGGVGQIQDITRELSTAFSGREADLRSLIEQIDAFAGRLNEQTGDIIAATESVDRLVAQFASEDATVDRALQTIPDALATVSAQRNNLVEAVDAFGKFSALAADAVNQTRESFVQELKDIAPVLRSLANAGPALTRSLSYLSTFPWPKETLANWIRGDYANLTAIIDLTLSRIDSSFFTGTRWEGDLTELEMQWGRTIGQMPSPYTAANPLTAPYHFDQGR
jgi:phospholipid/cholesterol/gamma-HCH transport system substrate-binding protein